MKLCKDCNHFDNLGEVCGHDGALRHVEPIRGRRFHIDARWMRENISKCGPDAVWFEHKQSHLLRFIAWCKR